MKNLIVLVLSNFMMIVCYCQDRQLDSLFIVTYTTGAAWDVSKKPAQQPFFREHSTNLSKMRSDGIIKFGARYADKGIIIISAKNRQEATAMVTSDQAVANKLFNADIQKLNVFYDGCILK